MQTTPQQPAILQPSHETKMQAAREGLMLWGVLLMLGVLVIVSSATLVLLMRRVRARAGDMTRRHQPAGDTHSAWEEAGRRMEVPPRPGAEDSDSAAGGAVPTTTDGDASPLPSSPRTPTPRPAAMFPRMPPGERPIALVTGGARRVGRAIALELARSGCDVMYTYRTSDEDARRLAHDISDLGRQATSFQVDLADPHGVEAFAQQVLASAPRLDVLVHNASRYESSPLDELQPEDAIRQFCVNANAPLVLTARLRPLLERSRMLGGGCVVCMTDIHAMGKPRRNMAAYTMSKAALTEMIYCLARDLAPTVRVNGVAPGVVDWPQDAGEMNPEDQQKYVRRIPLGRAGTPEDAAKAVRWVAMEATYMTGEVIRLDGGRWLT